ncbi:hypothetical protein [Polynucleobacter brandtiae]|uniref:DUF481 domain-containing protein n=1 Tax=Polynucleobacter brandtiae TaxID=1938816 RepID=A0A2M8VZT5_9BURK|nr:hypothetical protein [Polynucleobacter brandtiae]PJI83359.1 hypothetical protein B0G85_0756 [Polynucleobacter brandtiae]
MIKQSLLTVLIVSSFNAMAAPLAYKDGMMGMADYSKTSTDLGFNYSVTAKDAIGITSVYQQTDSSSRTSLTNELAYTRLAHRWNLSDAQANVWLFLGAGEMKTNQSATTKPTVSPGIQVDYETTRIYGAATVKSSFANNASSINTSFRTGFSFYETNYDEAQPWLIIEARRMSFVSPKYEYTPMLRIIDKSYFLELGANLQGQPRINFMYTY